MSQNATLSSPSAVKPQQLRTILLVEDEQSIGALVRTYLERDGFSVIWLRSGEEALAEIGRHGVQLVVLDIGLPGIDGFEVCRQIRAGSQLPILMLTARDEEADRVAGLELGADDYVSKPFSPRELVARVKAILRRGDRQERPSLLRLGPVELRREEHELLVDEREVELTSKEFDLLATLIENAGVVLSRERLLDEVWGMTYPGGTRTVDVHVAQVRRKLGHPELIRTVRGVGYKAVRQ
jgi:DNA-binding response OmpR family regulator